MAIILGDYLKGIKQMDGTVIEIDGKRYSVDVDANTWYDQEGVAQLPDGSYIVVNFWYETNPPRPGELHHAYGVCGRKVYKATEI